MQRMLALEHTWLEQGDRRAIFLRCYLMMTENMHAAVAAAEFNDNGWVNALVHHFADYYFNALDACQLNPQAAPRPWWLTYEAAGDPSTLVMQHLMLGINAHINYDLALALVDMLDAEWFELPPESRLQRKADHEHVNQVISRTIDQVQDQVIEPLVPILALADTLLGPIDEWLTDRLIQTWRGDVWEQATAMLESDDPLEREVLRLQLEQDALERGRSILRMV